MNKVILLLASFLLLFTNSIAQAHSRGESYSKWIILNKHEVDLSYTLKLADLSLMQEVFDTQSPNWQSRVQKHINQNLVLQQKQTPCKTLTPMSFQTDSLYLRLHKTFYCENINHLSITNNAIFDYDSRHIHIARMTLLNGEIKEKIFLSNDRHWSLEEAKMESNGLKTFVSYLVLGDEHILTGWDHLSFLAAILLLVVITKSSFKKLLLLVSGFTLGHSLSLILTALGYLIPDSLSVESLIAFSIALMAIECIAIKEHEHARLSYVLLLFLGIYSLGSAFAFSSILPGKTLIGLLIFVFCYFQFMKSSDKKINTNLIPQITITLIFGFIHGFGFAGSLKNIGLPEGQLLGSLLGFNLGVEVGQLLVLSTVFLVFYLLKTIKKTFNISVEISAYKAFGQDVLASVLCGLGVFWFIQRSII